MFGGPTVEQHDSLSAMTHALKDQLDIVTDMARKARAQSHYLTAMLGATMAELAANSENPYKQLMALHRRAKFTAEQFSPGGEMGEEIKQACETACEYSEEYLRFGDR